MTKIYLVGQKIMKMIKLLWY